MSKDGAISAADRAEFIRKETVSLPVPLVPEIRLHVADDSIPLWQKTEEELGEIGLPPPFWAFAWAGGQALARYVLDHPHVVLGKRVLDFAAGSGLVAIAAAKAGANVIIACDIDPFAETAIAVNAEENNVMIEILNRDVLADPAGAYDVILAGDVFYENALSTRVFEWLSAAADGGADILIGDPGRSYLPHEYLTTVSGYSVPVTRALEDSEIKQTAVWRLASGAASS